MTRPPQLFLLHFAGGNYCSFRFLTPLLHAFDTIALELPGRGKRASENLLYDLDTAMQDLYQQLLLHRNDAPFMIYGHSLGALLTLGVARMLERAGHPPAAIFVSGSAGPGIEIPQQRYLLDDAAFKKELQELGGMPAGFFEEPELVDYFLPILRADFQLADSDMQDLTPLQIPIHAMMGTAEENAVHIENWKNFTNTEFTHTLFDGGHFFIYDHPEQIAGIIKDHVPAFRSSYI